MLSGTYHFYGERNDVVLSGDFDLRFQFPASYPKFIPVVFEDSGLIPHCYHRNEHSSLCLGTAAELYVVFTKSPCLATFINEILNPYLYRWLTLQATGEVPWGDRSHGLAGVFEGYYRLLNMSTPIQVYHALFYILGHRDFRTNQLCPCGSGKKIKTCHRKQFELLASRVPVEILRTDFNEITTERGRYK